MLPLLTVLASTVLEIMIAPQPQPMTFLTATGLPAIYADVPEIKRIDQSTQLDENAASFLYDPKTPLEQKIAASIGYVTRFGFSDLATNYTNVVYKKPAPQVKLGDLRGDELVALGLLTAAMPADAERSTKILEMARKKLPDSFAVALTTAMMKGQLALQKNNDACAVFRLPLEVLRNEKLTHDMKQAAIDAMFDQAASFRDSCPNRGAR